MKKEYMKPVMESEVFVANEYVAACYQGLELLKCDECREFDRPECELIVALQENSNDNRFSASSLEPLFALIEFANSVWEKEVSYDEDAYQNGHKSVMLSAGVKVNYHYIVNVDEAITQDEIGLVMS